MTELLEQAMDRARRLTAAVQDEIARIVLAYAGDDQGAIQLTPEEERSFAASLAQAERGRFATDEEVAATWTKHGL